MSPFTRSRIRLSRGSAGAQGGQPRSFITGGQAKNVPGPQIWTVAGESAFTVFTNSFKGHLSPTGTVVEMHWAHVMLALGKGPMALQDAVETGRCRKCQTDFPLRRH